MRGIGTSDTEVTHISGNGFWILIDDQEILLPFDECPRFADAPVRAILNVERLEPHHLYWPEFDVDLSVESIEHPERFPLRARKGGGA